MGLKYELLYGFKKTLFRGLIIGKKLYILLLGSRNESGELTTGRSQVSGNEAYWSGVSRSTDSVIGLK